ncbi:DIS3-like exonuclease 2 isoform X2 [Lasioglossum baleicum]|uniref:DIS3-like exonuclease 2 isoform X2 n=1 Tax=Lasioglossum baleicum TaxID=434251 RepID=UPI003FCDD169
MSRTRSILENLAYKKDPTAHCLKTANENNGQRTKCSEKVEANGTETEEICSDICFPDELQNDPKQKQQKPPKVKKENKKKLKEQRKFDRILKNTEEELEKLKVADHLITLKKAEKKRKYPHHMPLQQVEKLLKDQNVEYVEGYLRINPRCAKYAYLRLPNDEADLLIASVLERNRALGGDRVVARINSPALWKFKNTRKTGVIVCILEKRHPRVAVGCLKYEKQAFYLYPRDKHMPILKINKEHDPLIKVAAAAGKNVLFQAEITDWRKLSYSKGRLLKMIGTAGEMSTESSAILLEHNLDVTPYDEDATKDLPNKDYLLTDEDTKNREDWRNECMFTIDPEGAVDLDDAVSCKLLENGNYEIGVHIADVTHYLEFLSPLDVLVAKRATSIYMTDNVYHMLPKQLCNVCSLMPGQDRLTFSVIFEMTPEGKVEKYRFAKTVINSCCKMSYKHAQQFIEDPENKSWSVDMLSVSGNYNINDLSSKINVLHRLATKRRDERFANGALQIDQPKLHVELDKTTGKPTSYWIEEQKESNRLIQEFMLLTNMTVAKFLYEKAPKTALLRNHKKPSTLVLTKTKDTLEKFGIHLDIETSGSLNTSLKRYGEELQSETSDFKATRIYRMMVINSLCTKAMNRATYNCASSLEIEEDLKHYALNVSYYTHFTSPIRRYSDCVIHRLLYSIIKNEAMPEMWSEKMCSEIAMNCNLKTWSAKLAQKQSSEMYLAYLVDLVGSFVTMAVVYDVKETSIDVILCQMGILLRIYFTDLKQVATVKYSSESSVSTIRISWKKPVLVQEINMFSLVYLKIEKDPAFYRLTGTIVPVIDSRKSE